MTSPYPDGVLPRSLSSRALVLLVVVSIATLGLTAPVEAQPVGAEHVAAAKAKRVDPRKVRGLFVDPLMPAYRQGGDYRRALGSKGQALWITPEHYPTAQVKGVVRAYTSRALKAKKTPVLSVYGIPDRDCGQYSAGGLPGAKQYQLWIRQIAVGLRDQQALVILEPDAIPFYGNPDCENAGNRLGLLRYASRLLSKVGAWVYLDAGHSDWRPYDTRPQLLKRAGIAYARGFSTNVSNFRPTADEQAYAVTLLRGLRALGVRGRHYVIDTSRNGYPTPVNGDVINPTWARIGKAPQLVFKGAYDGSLWIKHPGESDGYQNGGPQSGDWCDLLADRLLGRPDSGNC